MVITNNYSNNSRALCENCSKKDVCKYTDDVQTYLLSHRAPPEIECLSVEYKCKYFDVYSYALRTTATNVMDTKVASCSQVNKI